MTASLIHPNTREFVSRPWGWEDVLYNDKTSNFSMKRVFIKAMKSSGMHRHSVKEEVIFCDSGQLVVEHLDKMPQSAMDLNMSVRTNILLPDLGVRILPGTWHRLAAMEDTYLYVVGLFCEDEDSEVMPGYEEMVRAPVPCVQHPDGDFTT